MHEPADPPHGHRAGQRHSEATRSLPDGGKRYSVRETIGTGGMGEVFRGRDHRLHRDVAIKFLPPWLTGDRLALSRFHREARAAAALNHPAVLAVYDFVSIDGAPCLVSELLDGRTLGALLAAGPVPLPEAIEDALQILAGLAAAHEKGIVHRDLKPENVFVTTDGRLKVLDFGLAKLTDERAAETSTTMSAGAVTGAGAVVGTAGYTSPEQARGDPLDVRSDLFAFGAVFYQLLTGRRPFHRHSAAETTSAMLTETPPPPSALNPAVPQFCDAIAAKALEKDRELRYQSAGEIRADLLRGRRGLDRASRDPGPPAPPASRPSRLARPVIAAGAILGAASAAALVLSLLGGRHAVPPFEPRQVTVGLGTDFDPALSPDGNFLAYASDQSGSQDIWLLDLRSGSSVRRTTEAAADRHPVWMPDGAELLFVSDRDGKPGVWRMPALDGPASRLIPDADDVAVSPDGRQVAFARKVAPGETRIAVAPLADVSGSRFLTWEGEGRWNHSQPAWSPDGSRICYRAQMSLWTVPLAGGRPTQLLASNHFLRSPTWSHDGRHIYFSSNREGSEAIWRVDASGENLQRVTPGTGPESQPVVSADGRTLAFATRRDDFLLVIRDVTTGQEETWSTSSYETMPALSPDGRWVFFQSNAAPPNTQLWALALDRGHPADKAVRLTNHDGTVSHPAVSPDGRLVAYSLVEQQGGRRSIWTIPAAGGQPTRVTEGPEDTLPEWTPDGGHLLFGRSAGGEQHVWRVAVVAGRPSGPAARISRSAKTETAAVCAADGSSIAFTGGGETPDSSEVWVMPADGRGRARMITSGAQAERVRWEGDRAEELFVTGRWGGATLQMRRVRVSDGSVATILPPVLFGPSIELVDFSLSRDGQLLAFARNQRQGNIWVARARKGRF